MKISRILLETIFPITIGAIFIVGYFFITDKFFREPGLEDCESCYPSTLEYLKNILGIVLPISLYQIAIGNSILNRNGNRLKLSFLNSIVFAILVIGILIVINLFLRKVEWEFYPVIFIALILFGLLFTVLIKFSRKMFADKFIE
ncbi:hypothetical protein AAEO57_20630 [Flavobacterium sp. DGU38]|uniref:Vitamin K epoxide reductase family protein n=1 Tax=Flavobacterium calami TaxID=3139144 RepID=A0ABU9IUQ9_9FLAO